MSAPTLDSLQAQVNDLLGRVNALDGQNLAPPTQGFTAQTTAGIAGIRQDIVGSVLSLEANNNQVILELQKVIAAVNALLGLTNVAPPLTPPALPPST